MSKRVCAEAGCGELIDAGSRGGRCDEHRRAKERARGSSTARGYGADHQRLRAHYQRRMDRGEVFVCWRPDCDTVIDPHCWHLGHDDDRSITRGPECPSCNLSHAGRASHH